MVILQTIVTERETEVGSISFNEPINIIIRPASRPETRGLVVVHRIKKYKNHSNGYYDAQQYQRESVFSDHGFHM